MSNTAGTGFEPRIIAFCCQNSLYGAEDFKKLGRPRHGGVTVVELPCGGKIDRLYMLKVFEAGNDGVVVISCPEGECHLINGTLWAGRRVNYVNNMLAELGINGPRAFLIRAPAPSRVKFDELLEPVIQKLKDLGPLPVKAPVAK